MNNINAFSQFQSLIPKSVVTIVDILTNNGNGTSTARTLSGINIVVQGENVESGNRAYVQDGIVLRQAPSFTITEVTI